MRSDGPSCSPKHEHFPGHMYEVNYQYGQYYCATCGLDSRVWSGGVPLIKNTALPDGAEERKNYPIGTGVIDYFPNAIIEVARVSKIGNDQHNPGEPLHWDRSKSQDQADALMRHFIERGTVDKDGVRHSAKLAWRALALLQLEIEADKDG